jgi:phytoene dehydrogenase-like protein
VLFSAYPTLCDALDLPRLGLKRFRSAAVMAQPGHRPSVIGDAIAEPSLLWPTLNAPQLTLSDKVRMLQLRRVATSLAFDDCFAPQYDQLSTREFLMARGFSAMAIANFFAPFYGGILLDRSLATSAAVLLYTFKMLAEGRTVVPAMGMGAIPAQLAADLPPQALHTGVGVARLLRDDRGITGVLLDNGETVQTSRVVLAGDPPSVTALAHTADVRVATPVGALGCTSVYLSSPSPLLDGDALWLNTAATATVSHAITITNVAPSYAPPGVSLTVATVLGDAATLDDEELVRRVRADLSAMDRKASVATAELRAVWRVPYSQYAQPPGSVSRRVSVETGVPGLFIASEAGHTSSLEGAARGGLAAGVAVTRSVSLL